MLESIVGELASDSGAEIQLNVFAQREPGGIDFSDPLVARTRQIMQRLGIKDHAGPSNSELSALIDAGIPAITLGLSDGVHLNEVNEEIYIQPMFLGLAQLLGVLLAIDGGNGNGD